MILLVVSINTFTVDFFENSVNLHYMKKMYSYVFTGRESVVFNNDTCYISGVAVVLAPGLSGLSRECETHRHQPSCL